MIIKHDCDKIRYTGRWNVKNDSAVSTANGSYFEFMFKGETAVMGFDVSYLRVPFPHIFISIDDGAEVEATLDRFIRVSAPFGIHKVRVILKSSVESQHRWYHPIEAKTALLEIEAEEFPNLPEDSRPIIEFIGDSITEGISIDVRYFNHGGNKDMVYWDDSTASYAWLTAKILNFRPIIMGYGGLGILNTACGGVPPVLQSYKFYSDKNPIEVFNSDYVVINHGTNDRNSDKELFKKGYYALLEMVRKTNPKAKIFSLTPFLGCLAGEIKEVVDKYNYQAEDNVCYIDSSGWIPPEPLHPLREGHKTVSEKLSAIIKEKIGE